MARTKGSARVANHRLCGRRGYRHLETCTIFRQDHANNSKVLLLEACTTDFPADKENGTLTHIPPGPPLRITEFPNEILLNIFDELNDIDATSLGLISMRFHGLFKKAHPKPIELDSFCPQSNRHPNLCCQIACPQTRKLSCNLRWHLKKWKWITKTRVWYDGLLLTNFVAIQPAEVSDPEKNSGVGERRITRSMVVLEREAEKSELGMLRSRSKVHKK